MTPGLVVVAYVLAVGVLMYVAARRMTRVPPPRCPGCGDRLAVGGLWAPCQCDSPDALG